MISFYVGFLTSTPVGCIIFFPIQGFSPLYIGSLTSTEKDNENNKVRRESFSPLYIGSLTSTHDSGCGWIYFLFVSVPFISGLLLQHGEIVENPVFTLMFQSPLYRVSYFNHKCHQVMGRFSLWFQSPLYRVSYFNEKKSVLRMALEQRFSPLYIGSLTST